MDAVSTPDMYIGNHQRVLTRKVTVIGFGMAGTRNDKAPHDGEAKMQKTRTLDVVRAAAKMVVL